MSFAILGPITFEASSSKIRTWSKATREGRSRWATLDVYAGKPRREFIGPGLDAITLAIRLDMAHGVVPRDELRQMREQRDKGKVLQFTVGGQLVGDYTIDNVREGWTYLDGRGVLMIAEVELELQEYT